MPKNPRILAFAGSARRDSFNKQLVRIAAGGVSTAGVECTVIDLRDYPMPIYDGDLEASSGLPESAAKIRELLQTHHGLLISTPEYNSGVPSLLKNTIDWATRSPEATPDTSGFSGKLAALMATSPGPLGGARAVKMLRSILENIGCTVLAEELCIRGAMQAFEDGKLLEERNQKRAEAFGRTLAEWVGKVQTDL
jgi:chromate reductase